MVDWNPGMRVCVSGVGGDAFVHEHTTVERVTKTLIVTTSGRRFRRDGLHSVPYRPYSGTRVATHCQRAKTPRT